MTNKLREVPQIVEARVYSTDGLTTYAIWHIADQRWMTRRDLFPSHYKRRTSTGPLATQIWVTAGRAAANQTARKYNLNVDRITNSAESRRNQDPST